MACTDVARVKAKVIAINLIIFFLLYEIFETQCFAGAVRQDLGHWLPIMEANA
jgi:hypothetical protein